jgi:outer membrane protein, multidrug efflux system
MYELSKRMFEAGQRSELDMRTAEAQVQAARADVARLTRLRAQAENALVLLVGQALPANLPPPQPLASQTMIADLAPGIPSAVLLRRPDVLAAEHTLRAANANIGAARAAFFPTISLTGFAGFASTALTSLFSGGLVWSFTPTLSVPLFSGGRNLAALDVAKVRKRIEIARYERAIQVAFREVADTLAARETFEEQLAAQHARVEAEQVRFDLSNQRYRAGVESYLSVLEATNDLYSAQEQLIEIRIARLTNLADLYRALGGGWRE